MNYTFKTIFFYYLFFTSILANAQSGWTQGEKKYYVKISGQNTSSNQHFNQVGELRSNDTFSIFALGAYAEYGKTDRLTLIGFVPVYTNFKQPKDNSPNNAVFQNITSTALGDPEIAAKYKLFKNKWIATAITGKIRIPFAGGESNQGITLSAGFPLFRNADFTTYANIYGGANNRPKLFSDEWRYGFEFGIGYKNKLWLFLKQDTIDSFNNVAINTETERLRINELYGNRYETKTISSEIAYYIKPKFGVSFSYLNTFDGTLTLKGNTYSAGVFWNLR